MKNILNKLVVLLLAGFALAACTEHTEYDDTGFSAVEKLLYPSDGYALDLIEQADANLYFEWEVSKVGTPVYTVVFLDAAKKEIGRYLADNNGQKSSLKMLHSQLNAIAGDAGIEPDAAGDLYWTVSAGLGGAEQLIQEGKGSGLAVLVVLVAVLLLGHQALHALGAAEGRHHLVGQALQVLVGDTHFLDHIFHGLDAHFVGAFQAEAFTLRGAALHLLNEDDGDVFVTSGAKCGLHLFQLLPERFRIAAERS